MGIMSATTPGVVDDGTKEDFLRQKEETAEVTGRLEDNFYQ